MTHILVRSLCVQHVKGELYQSNSDHEEVVLDDVTWCLSLFLEPDKSCEMISYHVYSNKFGMHMPD